MSDEVLQSLRRQLDLIAAIDRIRDADQEPSAMLSALANLLTDQFEADVCLLSLVHRDSGELQLKAVNDRGEYLSKLGSDSLHRLSERAMRLPTVEVWDGTQALAEAGIADPPAGLHLAAAPIVAGANVRLGALLVGRMKRAFSRDERDLLKLAEDHLDSAIVQGYAYVDLQLRNTELQTIYRVDRIRDEDLPLDEMLTSVLSEIRKAIQAEMGFIMLYHRAGHQLELRAVSHDDLFKTASYQEIVDRLANESLKKARLVYENDLSGDVHSIMCVPLILRDEILGVFGVVNRYGPRGFDERDRTLLTAIASQMDTAIFEDLEQRRLRQVLGRSVDPHIMEHLLANPEAAVLKGERMTLSVLYADIRSSTALAEETDPERLVGFINEYLGQMSEVIFKHEGTLDKFVGDEVMALFGAPVAQPDHALRAVITGLDMIQAHQRVMDLWRKRGINARPIGIGIATGEGIVGEMGSALRTDYTVIGRPANLGARICAAAPGGQVWISQMTYNLIKDQVEAEPVTGLALKGIGENVTVYHVKQVKPGVDHDTTHHH
jgi:class 3 adenylate cyclase